MRALIEQLGEPPKSFMCSALLLLEGALQQIKAQTGKISKSILIGTFDDHRMLDFLPNRLLSIRQDEQALADRVFERLVGPRSNDRRNAKVVVVPTEMVCRNF